MNLDVTKCCLDANVNFIAFSTLSEMPVKLGDQASMRAFPVFPRQQFLVCASKRITSTRLAKITNSNTICVLDCKSTESVDNETQ